MPASIAPSRIQRAPVPISSQWMNSWPDFMGVRTTPVAERIDYSDTGSLAKFARSFIDDVEFGPLRDLAMKSPATHAHQLRGLRSIAPRLEQRFAQKTFFVFLHGERE